MIPSREEKIRVYQVVNQKIQFTKFVKQKIELPSCQAKDRIYQVVKQKIEFTKLSSRAHELTSETVELHTCTCQSGCGRIMFC